MGNISSTQRIWGLGFQNIYYFGKALEAKRLWRGTFSVGMWNDVIRAKYLKKRDLVDWIRDANKGTKGVLNCWKWLLNSF